MKATIEGVQPEGNQILVVARFTDTSGTDRLENIILDDTTVAAMNAALRKRGAEIKAELARMTTIQSKVGTSLEV